ncbi:MAG TPA: retropepsin-like aspartic protease [Blastocatellia bacterium]|nr:retropepsin-like aspartic protease [Blastocatellia bacterium]
MSRNWLQFSAKRSPVVSVRLGNGVFRALVDTGAEVSLINPNTALRLGLKKLGDRDLLVLGGARLSLRVVELPCIGFGNVELLACQVCVLEVAKLGLPIEIVLGINAFVNRRLQIDFREGRIYVLE